MTYWKFSENQVLHQAVLKYLAQTDMTEEEIRVLFDYLIDFARSYGATESLDSSKVYSHDKIGLDLLIQDLLEAGVDPL